MKIIHSSNKSNVLFAYAVVVQIFMGVYGTSEDAILHCYSMDEDMNHKMARLHPRF